jgi:hypothetical protein
MTNVLPQSYKRKIKKEFRLRFFIVILSLLNILVMIAGVLLIPSFVMSRSVHATLTGILASAPHESQEKTVSSVSAEVKAISNKLSYVSKNFNNSVRITRTLEVLDGVKTSGVTISSLHINTKDKTITVSGDADTRSNLIQFVDGLKAESYFSNINLPVSNLVEQTNLKFNLTFNLSAEAVHKMR